MDELKDKCSIKQLKIKDVGLKKGAFFIVIVNCELITLPNAEKQCHAVLRV